MADIKERLRNPNCWLAVVLFVTEVKQEINNDASSPDNSNLNETETATDLYLFSFDLH